MRKGKIRCPFPWFGGKSSPKIKKAILAALPPHRFYVEPFGGGAAILLAKTPAEVEVYNDVNRGVVNFFRVVASRCYFGPFMACVRELPYSRELYEEFLRTWPAIHDPVEQAVRWYFVARQSFGGMFGKSWGPGVTTTPTGRRRYHDTNRTLALPRHQPDAGGLASTICRLSTTGCSVCRLNAATGATALNGSAGQTGSLIAIRPMLQECARREATSTSCATATTRR